MNWCALPYTEEARLAALKVQYEINSLPTLLVLSADGSKVICQDARKDVAQALEDEEKIGEILTAWNEAKTA